MNKLVEVLVVVLLTSMGQLLLRLEMRGMKGGVQSLTALIGYIARTPVLWLAIGVYGVSTLLWLRILSRYPVSSVYPLVATGYVFVTLGGLVFLGERVPVLGWIALTIICFGTLLLAFTPW